MRWLGYQCWQKHFRLDGSSEEFQQDFYAIASGEDFSKDSSQALQRAFGNFNFHPGREGRRDGVDFAMADLRAQAVDDEIRNDGRGHAELDKAKDAGGSTDGGKAFGDAADENVTRKKSFSYPSGAGSSGTPEPKSGREDFQTENVTKMRRGDMFMFSLGAHGMPRGRGRIADNGEMDAGC